MVRAQRIASCGLWLSSAAAGLGLWLGIQQVTPAQAQVVQPPDQIEAPRASPQEAAASVAQAPAGRILDEENAIVAAFAAGQTRVAVIVNLAPPLQRMAVTDYADHQSLAGLQQEVAQRQAAVLGALPAGDFNLRHRYENFASFSGAITQQGLKRLAADPRVDSIEPVQILLTNSGQGIPLLNAARVRSNYNGAGMSIAIVDTGVDYSHPRLGGGGFPNDKVIGGRDFGDDDDDPSDCDGHGTACAGLAAGDLGTQGDYIGGVAHNARLYALKIVAGCESSASSDNIVAAWDWCVTHRNDDPDNPIMVISTSFGGGRLFSACDSITPSYAAAANAAVAAGITVLAAAGNDGFCDSIAAPACISSVISVGAVYDANIGSRAWCVNAASCAIDQPPVPCGQNGLGRQATDATTAADQVTAYSNTANFLDILAPSNDAFTTVPGGGFTSTFGGTSAACPYAAGAVACLQQAARTLSPTQSFFTPAQVRDILTLSGDPVTDTKVAITKPRVNLGFAVTRSLGTWVEFDYNDTERGTFEQPYNTFEEGRTHVPSGGQLVIKHGGATNWTGTIMDPVTILSWAGTATIGN